MSVIEQINFQTHMLYRNDEADKAPDACKDSNGDLVLALCKICGAGEIELYERPCK